MKRSIVLLLVVAFAATLILSGCSADKKAATPNADAPVPATTKLAPIKIGTLPTEDLLPLWVAEKENLLKAAGLEVEIITFQSAQEQIAAVSSGAIDGMMTDLAVPMQLTAGGTPMKAVTVMQGAPAGIIAGPKSGVKSLEDLAGVPIGAATPTIVEYIIDKALADAGVPADKIKIEEIKKVPVRFEMLMSGKVKAAGLPWTFYTLAEQAGATPLLTHEDASKYTSTVLEFTDAFIAKEGGEEAIAALLPVWNAGVEKINADPNSYRSLLVEKAKLPAPLAETYEVKTYPTTALPTQAQVEDVVNWMVTKNYLKAPLAYADVIYQP